MWIAEHFYQIKREKIYADFGRLLSLKKIKIIEISEADLFLMLKQWVQTEIDLIDIYLSHLSADSDYSVASFDQDFKRLETEIYIPAEAQPVFW